SRGPLPSPCDHLDPHSFPTRRSSDLFAGQLALTAYQIQQSDFQAAQATLDRAKKYNQMHPLQVLFQTDIYLAQNQLDAALKSVRSEEHTSELQSREKLVCRLLLETKK